MIGRVLGWLLAGVLGALALVCVSYETVPAHSGQRTTFDTLIVLGCPTDPDGKLSPEQRERVLEAVRDFQAGQAAHMIVTGGSAHNPFVEARVMAAFAVAQGVPAEDVLVEPRAQNTIQNIAFSHAMMQKRGWTSAEVVSSPSHLPRTALILEHWKMDWKTDASRWPAEYSSQRIAVYYVREALGTTVLRWVGFARSPYLPTAR